MLKLKQLGIAGIVAALAFFKGFVFWYEGTNKTELPFWENMPLWFIFIESRLVVFSLVAFIIHVAFKILIRPRVL